MAATTLLMVTSGTISLGCALWTYRDAQRAGRPALLIATVVFFLPYVAFGVYVATRAVLGQHQSEERSPNEQSLLQDMTEEIKRLRARVAELEGQSHGY